MMNEPPFSSIYQPYCMDSAGTDVDFGDITELGLAKEVLGDELYFPAHPSRDWIRCFITTTESGCFRMFLEGKKKSRFLLSAKLFPGETTFLISSHEAFPELETVPSSGYLARLELQRDRSYLLGLNYCHLCDHKFGYFQCGRSPGEREVLAKISHNTRRYSITGYSSRVEYRSVEVTVPAISKSGKRKVWCPRAFRASNPDLPMDCDVSAAVQLDRKMVQQFTSKAPEWNPEVGTLVVRFQGGRVQLPSAKNFLLAPLPLPSQYAPDSNTSNRTVPTLRQFQAAALADEMVISCSPMQTAAQRKQIESGSMSPLPPPHLNPHSPRKAVRSSDMVSVVSDSSYHSHSHSPPKSADSDAGSSTGVTTKSEGSVMTGMSRQSEELSSPIRGQGHRVRGTETASVSSAGSGSRHGGKKLHRNRDKDRDRNRDKDRQQLDTHIKSDFDFMGDGNHRALLQFGKSSPTKYILDFKYPLSPIQALGIALASFAAERHNSNASVISDCSDL